MTAGAATAATPFQCSSRAGDARLVSRSRDSEASDGQNQRPGSTEPTATPLTAGVGHSWRRGTADMYRSVQTWAAAVRGGLEQKHTKGHHARGMRGHGELRWAGNGPCFSSKSHA
jgi:hypothetical protein